MKRSIARMTMAELGKLAELQDRVESVATIVKRRARLMTKVEKLDDLIAKLLGGSRTKATSGRGRKGRPSKAGKRGRPRKVAKKRKFSAATRAKMRKAQQARWAKVNKAKAT